MRISDWSSDVCSSDLRYHEDDQQHQHHVDERRDVDLMVLGEVVATRIELACHPAYSATPRRCANPPEAPRLRSRETRRSTAADVSATCARYAPIWREK